MIITFAFYVAALAGGLALGLNVPAGKTVWQFATDRFKGSHAVDEITASLNKLHERLEAAIAFHSDVADAHRQDAAAAEARAVSAQAEAVQAARVASKVGALLT